MDKAAFDRVFGLPFAEASSFFRAKLSVPTRRWDDLWQDQHAKGFMVAGAYKAGLLADFRGAVQKAVDGQMSLAEFRKGFDAIVAKHGWSYHGSRNWRSELIWATNTRTAYMAGRWQQLTAPGPTTMPYLVYRHADGVRFPRPEHVAWDGITLPASDPWWSTHYPPNGWRCHCKVFGADEEARARAVREGKGEAPASIIDPSTGAPQGIDPGWDYNVGQAADRSYQILGQTFERLPNDISRQWMAEHVAGPAFERFVEGKIPGEFPVAVLGSEDMAALDTSAQTVWMSQETLLAHLDKHPDIGLADYVKIPQIIDSGEVYRQNEYRLIYLKEAGKLFRAVLKKTRDGSENYFLTLFETEPERALREVQGRYERIR